MSKFFYRGTPDVMGKHGKSGYKPEPTVKLGSAKLPLTLVVLSEQRKIDVQSIVDQHGFVANIEVLDSLEEGDNLENNDNLEGNDVREENIKELDAVLNKPKTQRNEKTPERNEPCSCGSGKKYKKCCG